MRPICFPRLLFLWRLLIAIAVGVAVGTIVVACGGALGVQDTSAPTATQNVAVAGFSLVSSEFKSNQSVSVRFSCDGQNISPELSWSREPQGTESFALIVDDPDAPSGIFTHWVLFNLPANIHGLPEGVPKVERLDNGASQGTNSARNFGYTGPCPPPGTSHHYRFSLYALNARLDLQPGASKQDVLDAMQGHDLSQTQIIGTYQRTAQ